MDLNGPSSRFRHRKSSTTDRFLGVSHSPLKNPSATTSSVGDELNEDDVFWTGDFAESSHQNNNNNNNNNNKSSSSPRHRQRLSHHKVFAQQDTFGILAALPEDETSPNIRKKSLFYHKASISSSSASSSRMIPVIPKPPQERIALPSSVTYHQSAPVNVPVMAKITRRIQDFDELDEEDDDVEDGEILPPHEIVARSSAHSPILACSVREGVGRTLKGRDLRQDIQKEKCIHLSLRDISEEAVLKFAEGMMGRWIDISSCEQVLKGKVTCLACPQHYNLAGIKVLVKCDKVKKLAMATTEEDGIFEVELPSDKTATSKKCEAKLFGGPNQIYASSKYMKSGVVKAQDSDSYTISAPLAFSTTCSSAGKDAKCGKEGVFGSSKTVDLPVPPEWGLAPTSYYMPFFPIIGIP